MPDFAGLSDMLSGEQVRDFAEQVEALNAMRR